MELPILFEVPVVPIKADAALKWILGRHGSSICQIYTPAQPVEEGVTSGTGALPHLSSLRSRRFSRPSSLAGFSSRERPGPACAKNLWCWVTSDASARTARNDEGWTLVSSS